MSEDYNTNLLMSLRQKLSEQEEKFLKEIEALKGKIAGLEAAIKIIIEVRRY